MNPEEPAPFRGVRGRLLPAAAAATLSLLFLGLGPLDPPHRVVLVSFDGAGGIEYARQRDAGIFGPDGFSRAEREGFSAERLETVVPSLTAVSHAAISTGAPPSATGIVSNLFHPAGAPLRARVSGFDVDSEQETLWEAATRQGKRVASLSWPGITLAGPRSSVPVAARWADPRTRGVVWNGPPPGAAFADAAVALPLEARSFSPPKSFTVELPGESGGQASVTFALVDGTDDGRRNYDELLALESNGALAARARAGDWFPLSSRREADAGDADVLLGRWLKVLALAPDASRVSLYAGGLCRTYAVPEDFRRTLDANVGFWPGPPDTVLLEGPEPDTKSFLEQADRLTRFLADSFDVAERRGDWDLLFAYQPVVDEGYHSLLVSDPRQPAYTRERAAQAEAALQDLWRIADRAAARYLRFRERGDVVIVSDHGLRPIHRTFHPLELMRRKGWVKTEASPKGLAVAADSPADAAVSGGAGFVILNRAGVLPGGTLSREDADRLLVKAAAAFRDLRDEVGQPVFDIVATRAQARPLGLDHPNAGDLVLVARTGTALRGGFPRELDAAPLFGRPRLPAQHGYGREPELDGIFFHAGDGIAPGRVASFPSTGVASRVAGRLGIGPPARR